MEENSDNCVEKEPYRILYSAISPVCPRGRKRVSIWKGADCISDFYNVQKASESLTQIDFFNDVRRRCIVRGCIMRNP